MESFFYSLKVEQIHGTCYATGQATKADVAGYLKSYYNRKRRH
ncbi:IS3 family transposase [Methylococcus geothermalis]|uniref:IS3 family transposase n=1 Tax=Methylococcus geothermalis TaxID=2681310 RepID=A0A858QB76_9GAMM|nr:IS3 family transposase [Methylococcus geothermalis]